MTPDWEAPMPAVIVVLALTAVSGWVCVFRTSKLVKWSQNNYKKSRIFRRWPGSGLVLKSWYPTYLRCMGIYAWAFGALILGLFLSSEVRH
jgi:hypothetical protein